MHQKTSIERILAIEKAMDVTAIRYKGLRLWPFIRMQMWRRLIQPHRFAPPGTVGLNYLARKLSQSFFKPDFYVPYLEHAKRHRNNLAKLAKVGPVDVLFYSKADEHTEKHKGQYYNRFLDPIADLIRTRYTYLKVELISDTATQSLPRFEQTHYLDSLEYIRCDAQRSLINAFQKNGNGAFLEGGEQVASLMASIRFDLALTKEYLMVEAERLLHYIRYFREVLRIIKPKAVFMSAYHDELSMALVAACKPLGIKTVDIQRDFPGAFHGMYTHWMHVPDQGYKLLPDYFWCWSASDVKHIQAYAGTRKRIPRAIIGGNCWLAKCLVEGEKANNDSMKTLLDIQKIYNQRILVTLSEVEDCLPDNLLEAIRMGPPEWLWMLRVHPGMEHKIEELSSLFHDLKIHNVEINLTSNIPLYQLLPHVDWHVSEWSSTSFDALRFSVPSIFVHPDGRDLYSHYLGKGVFLYGEHVEDILRLLANPRPVVENPEGYVITNPVYALDSVLEIMEQEDASIQNAPTKSSDNADLSNVEAAVV